MPVLDGIILRLIDLVSSVLTATATAFECKDKWALNITTTHPKRRTGVVCDVYDNV